MIKSIKTSIKNRIKLWQQNKNNIARLRREKLLAELVPSGFYFSHQGYCVCCDSEVTFVANHQWLRDYFECTNCLSIPRERALMHIIELTFPNWKNLKIHESSPGNRGTSIKLRNQCKNYMASQYYPSYPFGTIIQGFRNEDLENQTFADGTFDIVVTQDVMEHIYNPERAFREIARTLKPGGAHIFSVPLVNKHKVSEVWAVKGDNGEPVFCKTPEYHGNPIDPTGSPVTMHWGYDIVDYIERVSGLKTKIEYINNLQYGIRAEYIEILISRKNE